MRKKFLRTIFIFSIGLMFGGLSVAYGEEHDLFNARGLSLSACEKIKQSCFNGSKVNCCYETEGLCKPPFDKRGKSGK
jgi:hypothetical protein